MAATSDGADALTERQQEVLGLLAEGRSTRWIAKNLAISENTVRNHVGDILLRLGAHNRLEAVAMNQRFLNDPATRLLAWCEDEGIRLLPWQQEMIRGAFVKSTGYVQPAPPFIPEQPTSQDVTVTMTADGQGRGER